jgi:hypothetical protein
MPRNRVTLMLAAAGVAAALIAAVTVGVSAAASVTTGAVAAPLTAELAESPEPTAPATAEPTAPPATELPVEPTAQEGAEATGGLDPVSEEESPTEEQAQPVTPAADQDQSTTPAPAAEPVTYDASTDITTIPRPPAGWSPSELANAEVWLLQQSIVADCMLDKGFDYVFMPWWMFPPKYNPGSENWDGDFGSPKGIALDGEPDRGLGEDYDWREAGCYGYAVHVTGMDNAN